MASIRDIKRRKTSIQSTQQITKAMKLVATAKLQKAKTKAEETEKYFNKMYETVTSILSQTGDIKHQYIEGNDSEKKGYIVISSNRGLAGGYNSNVLKLILNDAEKKENKWVYPVGKKATDGLRRREYNIVQEYNHVIEGPEYNEAVEIGKKVLEDYLNKEISEIYLIYTDFISTISQEAKMIKLLPIEKNNDEDNKKSALMNYEPSEEDVLDIMIPRYIYSLIYGGLMKSVASEHGARMTAMDSATNNAKEIIDDLSLEYNRARQASITQEISEIVGGAEALK
ncbi:ATP synthase F1 subcomplex gamma subunit [Natranaerovirga hydrolytica]|uniref:ATP synthase gamma chain n=1 Tax=Natranaerovirga hydrolytica TaxID=680378 RepID=A0A4V2PYZ9_9FIRM|nr:ATP synthase F1 subunit gamma [Natranaerovirga hydrolytica]TCK87901.1 ATP synthase F1 subcomplex gamma subunit [Natranaerovirga hydrolytica]